MAEDNTHTTTPAVEAKDNVGHAPQSVPPAYQEKSDAPVQPPVNMPAPAHMAAQEQVTPLERLGDAPQLIDCPFCHQRARTRIGKEGTSMQILAGALCCLFCVCFTCIPCLAGWCEEKHYYCTACNQRVAIRDSDDLLQIFGPQMPPQGPPLQVPPPTKQDPPAPQHN